MKPITPQKIHAVLRKAGVPKSKSHPTRIRGWRDVTPGYIVEDSRDALTIYWRMRSLGLTRLQAEREVREGVQRIALALEIAGIEAVDASRCGDPAMKVAKSQPPED